MVSNFYGSVLSAPATLLVDWPVRWGSAEVDGNGLFHLHLIGPGNTNYVMQASTNLTTWVPLATNTVPNGIWDYVDLESTNFSHRFYRASQGP